MSNALQNILIMLGLLMVGGVGWYMYSENQRSELDTESGGSTLQAEIQSFIQTQQTLGGINIDVSIVDDPAFSSLRSSTGPVESQPSGRDNPFVPSI